MTQATPAQAVDLPFQAEVQQVLSLVINSLYANKEVFLRELVSNASDALDKARFLALTREDVTKAEGEAQIAIRLDEEARTLTIEDNGVGMTRDEAIQNLGTIARSGSLEFLEKYKEAAKSKEQALELIGQFGVGFYAAFMVASRIDVTTRSMLPGAEPVLWRSAGAGTFTVLPGEREQPGHRDRPPPQGGGARVREDVAGQGHHPQVQRFRERPHPRRRRAGEPLEGPLDAPQVADHRGAARRVLPPSDRQRDETPLLRVHSSVDAPVQFHALLYVPESAPIDLFRKEMRGGIRLYAKRVLILEDCDKVLPVYLRFVRGVVDSEDLRSTSRARCSRRTRPFTRSSSSSPSRSSARSRISPSENPERYATFWGEFGRVLKEGLTLDWKNKDAIAELCRFESMKSEAGKLVSLRQYVDAMPEAQKEIYYVTGLWRRAVEQSPHLEAFKKRGFDVLFLVDAIDEWVVQTLNEFDKKKLRSIVHGDIDLGDAPEKETRSPTTPPRPSPR